VNRNETAAAVARQALLDVLHEGQDQVALDLLRAAKAKNGTLTFGLLQTALVQLIAEKQVRVDDGLRIAAPATQAAAQRP
jgi:hypothetical protein